MHNFSATNCPMGIPSGKLRGHLLSPAQSVGGITSRPLGGTAPRSRDGTAPRLGAVGIGMCQMCQMCHKLDAAAEPFSFPRWLGYPPDADEWPLARVEHNPPATEAELNNVHPGLLKRIPL
jgi:hypothetical protein